MDISCLMVHAEQIEGEKLKGKYIETKRVKTGDGNFSHARSDGHVRPRFQQRFSFQGYSNAPPKVYKDKVSSPKPEEGNGSGSSLPMFSCIMCGKKHEGKCITDTDGCLRFGKSGLKMRDFPMLTTKGREGKQALYSGSSSNAPKQNQLNALQTRGEQEGSPDVVTRYIIKAAVQLISNEASISIYLTQPTGGTDFIKEIYRKERVVDTVMPQESPLAGGFMEVVVW
ncbi:uncharacterized protein LOC125830604 [Solanum verrucosum]|uniref:uncharacterized protein LOC125830604 n=1 Tax=Solanum verrucosum TaxID=315347 RepID=UPI0020D1B2A4|nr:uncharacterized protein LOC125830604 [Solanum verrucosum]